MAYRIVVELRARRDAESTYDHIAKDSPSAAADWYEGLLGCLESLGDMPERCPIVPEDDIVRMGLRHFVYGNYRILFTIAKQTQTVHVVHVRHAAQRSIDPERGASEPS